ncbi:MAG: osmoprotectant transport system permease protein [Streptosporangiaceae bacterium]|nr:transporter permease [Streptosporangiaceae bacterium]MDX6294801.1 osmoprotectant transport system permease protein [Kribbellaceae bacterium]MDX6433738.1 osmoprotectant transport system permease protein [Streptosporangiaceae bacterium]
MFAEPATATAIRPARERGTKPRWEALRHLLTPLVLAAVIGGLYLWVSAQSLDSIERRTLNADYIITRVSEHLKLTAVAVLLVVVIAIPLGVVLSRRAARWVSPLVLGLANLGQATPAIGLLVLLTIKFGVGFRIAIIGLVAYAVLPVLRNTIVGIQQVDPALVEAARGMGMTRAQVLFRVEMKMAIPVILAGLRTALVMAVGVATLATFVNAGGLGDIIVNGIKLNRTPVLLTGSVLTACIAFLVDWIGSVAEDLLRPKGV